MIFLFYGIISLIIIFLIVKYLANINSNKLQSLIKIILGGIFAHCIFGSSLQRFVLFFWTSLVLSLWLTRLKTFYDFYNSFFRKIIIRFQWIKMKHLRF